MNYNNIQSVLLENTSKSHFSLKKITTPLHWELILNNASTSDCVYEWVNEAK